MLGLQPSRVCCLPLESARRVMGVRRVCQGGVSAALGGVSLFDREAFSSLYYLAVLVFSRDLKKTTGDWFYDQRVNRFLDSPGHDMVRVSLRKRPQGENRKLPPATSCRRRISLISSERMHVSQR